MCEIMRLKGWKLRFYVNNIKWNYNWAIWKNSLKYQI